MRPPRLLTCSVFDYVCFDAHRWVSQPSTPRELQPQEPCAKITRCSFCHTKLLFRHFWSETRLSGLILWENIFVRQSNVVAYQEACDSLHKLFTPGLAHHPCSQQDQGVIHDRASVCCLQRFPSPPPPSLPLQVLTRHHILLNFPWAAEVSPAPPSLVPHAEGTVIDRKLEQL